MFGQRFSKTTATLERRRSLNGMTDTSYIFSSAAPCPLASRIPANGIADLVVPEATVAEIVA
jgi:hypothetical protein